MIAEAERAAAYLVERARLTLGPRAHQGARPKPDLRFTSPALGYLGEQRLCHVPERALSALFEWAAGLEVELRTDVPAPSHVLGLQARGRRCVSLLPLSREHGARVGFDFVIHDLCHLGKFTDPSHHAEQVGYFHTLAELFADPGWLAMEAELDRDFREDRERLSADMNGSSVYLFAVLKMRLKMAARRAYARGRNVLPRERGGLDAQELLVFAELEAALYDALGFRGALRDAARRISARHDAEDAARVIQAHFAALGRGILGGAELVSETRADQVVSDTPPS